jgi:hypothetical protein
MTAATAVIGFLALDDKERGEQGGGRLVLAGTGIVAALEGRVLVKGQLTALQGAGREVMVLQGRPQRGSCI